MFHYSSEEDDYDCEDENGDLFKIIIRYKDSCDPFQTTVFPSDVEVECQKTKLTKIQLDSYF